MSNQQNTYYAALVEAWNSTTQPPTGITGAPLLSTDSIEQKIAKVNEWGLLSTIPSSFRVTGSQVVDSINWAEFAGLTQAQQNNILHTLQVPGDFAIDASRPGALLLGMMNAYFPSTGPTISALLALASIQIRQWWQVPVVEGGAGLSGPISQGDTDLAGLT